LTSTHTFSIHHASAMENFWYEDHQDLHHLSTILSLTMVIRELNPCYKPNSHLRVQSQKCCCWWDPLEVIVYKSVQVNHGDPSDKTNILFHKPQLL
jgi:hypothetical protein